MAQQNKRFRVVHTKAQRLWGIVGLAALFICGLMVGWGLNSSHVNKNAQVAQVVEPTPNSDAQTKETCAIIEDLLMQKLYPEDAPDVMAHESNIVVYEKLIMNGCSENQMKYHKQIQREQEIVKALQQSGTLQETCEQIESLLMAELPDANGFAENRIVRAKIFANLSERGCAANSEKYVAMAKQELEIARALEDDEFDKEETIEVVETYKRLNMQAAAEEIFETAKKLTNPAIDFILEVEKIINEN